MACSSKINPVIGEKVTFNSRLRDELLNREPFLSVEEIRYVTDRWRMDYNHYRSHTHTFELLKNLIDLDETREKPEKAKEWREKLQQIEDIRE